MAVRDEVQKVGLVVHLIGRQVIDMAPNRTKSDLQRVAPNPSTTTPAGK